jgi:peptide-methionine (S)-S-oxide reductase
VRTRNEFMRALTSFSLALAFISYPHYSFAADSPQKTPGTEKAVFAGGCFWCMQPPFDKLPGVKSTSAGYTGGQQANPTYEQVSAGITGHCEAVEVVYDPAKISYERLLDVFWRNIDPTQKDGQFVDIGAQYRTAIFYQGEEQRKLALASKERLERSGVFKKPIVTEITPASVFYPAETYHQSYYKKNPVRYKYYHHRSGREKFLKKTWGNEAKSP